MAPCRMKTERHAVKNRGAGDFLLYNGRTPARPDCGPDAKEFGAPGLRLLRRVFFSKRRQALTGRSVHKQL